MATTADADLQNMPEPELVSLAQSGDMGAMDILARRYRPPAYRLAVQLLGRPEDAKDVTQDAMLRFFSSLRRFDTARPVLPWLFRIVHNRVRDVQRRRQRRKTDSLECLLEDRGKQPVSAEPSPEKQLRRRRLQERLWKHLAHLSLPHREILVLRDYQDLSYSEIAAVLGIPKGTVMSRLHAARRRLAERLRNDDLGLEYGRREAPGGHDVGLQ